MTKEDAMLILLHCCMASNRDLLLPNEPYFLEAWKTISRDAERLRREHAPKKTAA